MKTILRELIRTFRSFLDKAEASLEQEKNPQPKLEEVHIEKNIQSENIPTHSVSTDEHILLVPFDSKKRNSSPSTYKDRKILNNLLNEWVLVSGIEVKQAKAMLRKHAHVPRIDYMTIGQVDEACEWLREQIACIPKQQKL